MGKYLEETRRILIILVISAFALLMGSSFIAWSAAYWRGLDRGADRYITSLGPGGFVVSYLAPIGGLIVLGVGARLILGSKLSHWFQKVFLLLVYCGVASLLIMETTEITQVLPISINYKQLFGYGLGIYLAFLIIGVILFAIFEPKTH